MLFALLRAANYESAFKYLTGHGVCSAGRCERESGISTASAAMIGSRMLNPVTRLRHTQAGRQEILG